MSLSQRKPVDETPPEDVDPLQAEIEALAARAEAAEARVRAAAVEILKLRRLLRYVIKTVEFGPRSYETVLACEAASHYLHAGSESREAADTASGL